MKYIQPTKVTSTMIVVVILLSSMGWASAEGEGMTNRLKDCPASPNCVSSDGVGSAQRIPPLQIVGELVPAWTAQEGYLAQTPEFTIVEKSGRYLRAEARTRILRFIDDVEFMARPEDGIIAMRSASRVGYYDFGANRRRLEAVRDHLIQAGVVRPIE